MAQDLSIQKAFLDGMKELWDTVFTTVDLVLLDTDNTIINEVYGEVVGDKIYLPPLTLPAKVDLSLHELSDDTEGKSYNATFRFPTKVFLDNNIDLSVKKGLDILRKAKIEYQGAEYEIQDIKPQTTIQGVYLFYQFLCNEVQ